MGASREKLILGWRLGIGNSTARKARISWSAFSGPARGNCAYLLASHFLNT